MNKTKDTKAIRLLPNYCKKIGLVLIILSLLPFLYIGIKDVKVATPDKDILKVTTFSIFILGLSLIAWAKDKMEDEMTILIRLKAIAWSFGYTVFYVIIAPIGDLVFYSPVALLSAYQVVFTMLIAYIIMYYILKAKR